MSLLSSSSALTSQFALSKHSLRTFTTSLQFFDHYQTLGVPRNASKAQIKSHYYQLSKKHHPDVSNDPASKGIFTSASEAYSVLINDRQRRAYDRTLVHRSPGPLHSQSHGYAPRAPHTSGPRATYAWETSPRPRSGHPGFRNPQPDYGYTYAPPPNRPPGATSSGGAGRHYSRPQDLHHDVLRGYRKEEEEAQRQMDRIQNTSSFVRALQVMAALALSLTVMGGVGGG